VPCRPGGPRDMPGRDAGAVPGVGMARDMGRGEPDAAERIGDVQGGRAPVCGGQKS